MFLTNLIASCLFALAPISNVPQIEQDQQYNEVYENKNRSNLVDDFGYTIISIYELLTRYEFITQIDTYFQAHLTDTNYYSLPPYYVSDVRYCTWMNVYMDNPSVSFDSLSAPLTDIAIKLYRTTSAGYNKVDTWDIKFTYTTGNTFYFVYRIEVVYNASVSNARMLGTTFISLIDSTPTYDSSYYLICRSNSFIANNVFARTEDYNNGYEQGYRVGYDDGYDYGTENPTQSVRDSIYNEGRQVGYSDGLQDGLDTDSVALTIFTGFVDVGLLPVNVFLKMFEYEVFGINIAGLMSGVLTIAIVVIIVRVVTGKKND